MQHTNEVISIGPAFSKYFILHYNEKTDVFQFPEDRTDVIERENDLSGYFCIITSEEMSAKEALNLYKSRDTSEKLFRGDKSYLGDKSLRVYGDSSGDSKIFIEFIALIIRNKIYTYLKDEMKALAKRPNFMTVPAALVEDFFVWVKKQAAECAVPPKSKTAQGLNYIINQEVYLKAFLTDGDVPIDNSASERSIRTFCIGKKNWMFHNTAKGASASALVYSISETAKLNNLRPYNYFKYILTERKR